MLEFHSDCHRNCWKLAKEFFLSVMGEGFRRCERTSDSAASDGLGLNFIVLIIIDFHSSTCYLKMSVQVIWLPGAMIHKFTSQLSHSFMHLASSFSEARMRQALGTFQAGPS